MKNPNDLPVTREGTPTDEVLYKSETDRPPRPRPPRLPQGGMPPDLDENVLLTEIKNSIVAMQQQMQETYNRLGETKVTGKSNDGYIEIIMTATYQFEDIKINPRAFGDAAGKFSQKEFEYRLRQAWKDLSEKIQKTTQSKTMELLQSMNIPEDIRNISMTEEEDKKDDQ